MKNQTRTAEKSRGEIDERMHGSGVSAKPEGLRLDLY